MNPGKTIKTIKSKKGKDVTIRYPKWEDLDDMLTFANDLSKEDTFVLLSGETLTRTEEIEYLSDALAKMEQKESILLIATVNGIFAANSGINRFKRRKKDVGELHISVASKFRDEGVGRELLLTLIEEGKKIGLKLLILNCFENNDRALHLYESLGFKKSGLIPNMYAYKGSFIGEVTLYLSLVSFTIP